MIRLITVDMNVKFGKKCVGPEPADLDLNWFSKEGIKF